MRTKYWPIAAVFVALSLTAAAAQDKYAGLWVGGWEGPNGSSGGIELTLEKGKDDEPAGRVSITGEPTYKATFKALTFDGAKMTARYDFPPDESIEIVLTATFDNASAKGTWAAREKASGNVGAEGTFSVTKK
jgi:hypothetical protein